MTLKARRSWHSWKSSGSLKYEVSFNDLVQAVTAGAQLSIMTYKILLVILGIPFLHCFLVCLALPE